MYIKCIIAKGMKILLNPPALNNCIIDKSSTVGPRTEMTSCKLGRYSYVGQQCFMVNADIGGFCSIADRVTIGGASHPMNYVSTSPVFHVGKNVLHKNFSNHKITETEITVIENDVWIGQGAFIKAGVKIHNGAVVGMGSIVTKDVPPYEIWAGNPARKINDRFDEEIKNSLIKSKWWEWDDSKIASQAHLFNKPELFINSINDEIEQS